MTGYSMDEMQEMRTRVWATRDGCYTHYPRYCPPDCPNAGIHDTGLADMGACECHRCRFATDREEHSDRHQNSADARAD